MTELSKETQIERLQVKLLFVNVGEECIKHLKDGKQKISSFFSVQQKAATQMFMHTADSVKDVRRTIIIFPSDTDFGLLTHLLVRKKKAIVFTGLQKLSLSNWYVKLELQKMLEFTS